MHFIRDAFKEGGNTHMIEVIIGIADYLDVPVIAEGVETEDQLRAMKILGCDIVQGYFFSRPVPAEEFEPFILQRKEVEFARRQRALEKQPEEARLRQEKREMLLAKPGQARGELEENESAADTADAEQKPEAKAVQPQEGTGIQLKTASVFFVILALIAAVALMLTDVAVTRGYQRMEEASDQYISAQMAAADMEAGSDYLTDRVRSFVVTGEIQYLRDFFEEVETTRRRDNAVEKLAGLLGGQDIGPLDNLNTALALSNKLIGTEDKAMRLVIEAGEYDLSEIPDEIMEIELTEQEQELSPSELKEKAQGLVFDNNYMHYKDRIRENVGLCTQALIHTSSQGLERVSERMTLLLNIQTLMTILFLAIVLLIVAMITLLIRRPLTTMVKAMQEQKIIPPTGVEELQFVTRIYNKVLQENAEARERLSHEASHDALTGLFNRGAYDLLMESADKEHMALLLIDVDYFKSVNDTYGHAVGDRVLKRVAEILRHSFRSVDILCRIGGDEFAVVMTRVNSSMKQLVINKIHDANELLQHPKDDLPPVSLSVGVAFSDRDNPQGDIFHDADTALYRVKEAGRKGCAVYE
ncbi:MAG: diguanylate cyclase, partial [Eubacterium sp.]|nr:diguanylate cyclase [Eubacterium sp.]